MPKFDKLLPLKDLFTKALVIQVEDFKRIER